MVTGSPKTSRTRGSATNLPAASVITGVRFNIR